MMLSPFTRALSNFNPRPPWGGRRHPSRSWRLENSFQSTPSVGRATRSAAYRPSIGYYFNPRPPWGGRPIFIFFTSFGVLFQSTPSVGRATIAKKEAERVAQISIHALRGEGDALPRSAYDGRFVLFQSTPSVGRATPDAETVGTG